MDMYVHQTQHISMIVGIQWNLALWTALKRGHFVDVDTLHVSTINSSYSSTEDVHLECPHPSKHALFL